MKLLLALATTLVAAPAGIITFGAVSNHDGAFNTLEAVVLATTLAAVTVGPLLAAWRGWR